MSRKMRNFDEGSPSFFPISFLILRAIIKSSPGSPAATKIKGTWGNFKVGRNKKIHHALESMIKLIRPAVGGQT